MGNPSSPAPAAARSSSWSGATHAAWNHHTLLPPHPHPKCTDPRRGGIYVHSEASTQAPMDLPVLKKLWEDAKLQSHHMLSLHGSEEWVTLQHAGSPSSRPTSAPPPPPPPPATTTSSEPAAVQAQLHSHHPQWLPSDSFQYAITVDDIPQHAERKCIPMPQQQLPSDITEIEDRVNRRVEQLMKGFDLVPGKETEVIMEALSRAASRVHQQEEELELENQESPVPLPAHSNDDSLQMSHHDNTTFPPADKATSHFDKSLPQLARKEDLAMQEYDTDGAAHEIGPFSYAQLQLKAKRRPNYDGVVAYRKSDDTWPPISAVTSSCHSLIPPATQETRVLAGQDRDTSDLKVSKLGSAATLELQSGGPLERPQDGHPQADPMPLPSHPMALDHGSKQEPAVPGREDFHPQSMGYMNGKRHEPVIKSHRSPDSSAMLLEGSEEWFSDKRSRSTAETSMVASFPLGSANDVPQDAVPVPSQNSSSLSNTGPVDGREDGDNKYDFKQRDSEVSHPMSSAVITSPCFSTDECRQSFHPTTQVTATTDPHHPKNLRLGKRRCLLDIREGHTGKQPPQMPLSSDFKPSVLSPEMGSLDTEVWAKGEVHEETNGIVSQHNWGTVDSHLLMRVFTFLEVDLKSLVCASATCKSWRMTFDKFKEEANLCSDAALYSFTGHPQKSTKMFLRGCTALSSLPVRNFLDTHPCITTVDLNGSDQLKDLEHGFRDIECVGSRFATRYQQGPQELHRKVKSLKLIGEREAPAAKAVEGVDAHSSDDSICKGRTINLDGFHTKEVTEPMDLDPPSHRQDRDSETSHIARSNLFVKRMTLNNAGKFMKVRSENPHRKVVLSEYAIVSSRTRDKEQVAIHERKLKQKSVPRLTNAVNAHRDNPALKGDSLLGGERGKNSEKLMAHILKTVKEADTNKLFFHPDLDSKGTSSVAGRALAFPVIEEKLRGGGYLESKGGLTAFKDDLFLLCRSAFHFHEKGSQIFKAGEDIFKLAYRLVTRLEKSFIIESPSRDGPPSKSFKRKYHNLQSGSTLVGRKRQQCR